jgi:tetratricopeptide (TPR) repeat protein
MNSTSPAGDDHYQAAQELAIAGRHEDAVAEYSAAIQATRNHLKAICGRGLALQRLGRHEEALADFDRILALQPDWAGASVTHFAKASSRYMLGDFAGTIAECEETLRMAPSHFEAIYLRGIAAKALGDFALAESDMSKTLESDPEHLGALSTFGKLQLLTGNVATAIELFTRALSVVSPNSQDAIDCFRLRGVSFQTMSKHAEAIADFTQVLAWHPRDVNAYFRRSQSFDAIEEMHQAAADLDRGESLLHERESQGDGEVDDKES